MIRIDNTIYYVDKDKYTRQPKVKSSFKEKAQWEIRKLEYKVSTRKSQLHRVKDEEELSRIKEEIALYESEIKRLEEEIRQHQKTIQNPQRKFRKKYKKVPQERVRQAILEHIEKTKKTDFDYISKEEIMYLYNIPMKQINVEFMKLNREGILSQRQPRYAHDTTRNPFFYGGDSGWASDIYKIK